MTDAIVREISDRYIELYEHITGEKFVGKETESTPAELSRRIERNIIDSL